MNYYFVDYENVGSDGLNGIDTLDANNSVFIFYSRNADKITFDVHMQMNLSKAEIRYFKAETGQKNALDFQLSSYMGYVIRANESSESEYYIVSKDNGFNALISFWNSFKINIKVIQSLSNRTPAPEKPSEPTTKELRAKLEGSITDKAVLTEVLRIIRSYKTKQGINNALVKKYESQKAGEIYKLIKPYIAYKKGS